MSSTSSSGVGSPRSTTSATTPGCGMKAMSGVSLAWIFCMIVWLMFSTVDHLIVMPLALAFSTSTFSRPSLTGGSMLLQMVTDLSSSPLSPPLPQLVKAVAAARAVTATRAVRPRVGIRILFSSEELALLDTWQTPAVV